MMLRELRRAKDISLREAATSAGIQASKLSDYEFGRDLPSTTEIETLARIYCVDPDEIRKALPAPGDVIALAEKAGRMLEAFAAAKMNAKQRGLGRGNGGTGSVGCPACGTGTVCYSVAASNGHMWARCSTEGCAAWME